MLETLQDLVEKIAEEEKHFVQIVVTLSENPWDNETDAKPVNTTNEIASRFGREVDEGLIEVIAPPKEWYKKY